MVLQTETELKIIESAERLFYQKGKAGTSMQDIADDAGINRTLLNYYYRSKDQLFEAVFKNALSSFIPNVAALLQSDIPFSEYVQLLIEMVIDAMLEKPQIPIFVLQELTSNPDRVPDIIRELGIDADLAVEKMKSEDSPGTGNILDPRQVIMNVLSLCIFPFAARPVVTEILFNGNDEAYIEAMKQRKELLPLLVQQFMTKNPQP